MLRWLSVLWWMVGEVIRLRVDIVWVRDRGRMVKWLLGVVWVGAVHFWVI